MPLTLKKQVLTYCIITFLVTWMIAFGIYGLYRNGRLSQNQLNLYHSWAAIGPTIAAIISTYYFYGKAGVKRLLEKLKLKFPNKNVALYFLSPILFFIIGLIFYRTIKGEWYSFGSFAANNWSTFKAIITWILPLITYAFFEEIGWRGFLLPHFQEKYNSWKATIYLAVIWALWHIPFFFYRFDFSIGISIGFFFGIFIASVILTHIYNSSRGFIISAILFHFLNNVCSMFDKEFLAAFLSIGFIFLAVYIYRKYGKLNLSETTRTKNYLRE